MDKIQSFSFGDVVVSDDKLLMELHVRMPGSRGGSTITYNLSKEKLEELRDGTEIAIEELESVEL